MTNNSVINSTAIFSKNKQQRYILIRKWNKNPLCLFFLLNPSFASELLYDNTTMKVINFVIKKNIYGGVIILNLFSFINTNPKCLKKNSNNIINFKMIQKVFKKCNFDDVYCVSKNKKIKAMYFDLFKNNSMKNYYYLHDNHLHCIHPRSYNINNIPVSKITNFDHSLL